MVKVKIQSFNVFFNILISIFGSINVKPNEYGIVVSTLLEIFSLYNNPSFHRLHFYSYKFYRNKI